MKLYTFILQDPNEKFPLTNRFKAGSIISATNAVMRNKKLQGFTIVEAYCGNKSGGSTYQLGYIVYGYLAGKTVKAPVKHADEQVLPSEFGGLLAEVDAQCAAKTVTD